MMADTSAREPLSLDIVSDVICPWCFIGKRRLDDALAQEGDAAFDIRWRPYRLDPTIPDEGVDRQAYLKAKFGGGDRAKAVYAALIEAGASAGISFRFDKIAKTPNTLDAHRVIRWSASAGRQGEVVEALFRAYFLEGEDVGARSVLTAIAAGAGMDPALVGELLQGPADRDLVEREDSLAHGMGISGVPCFIVANKFALMGAQDPAILRKAFARGREADPSEPSLL